MVTYSINNGTVIESMTYNIIGATAVDLSPVLDILPDNIAKEINPKDVRDSILTAWSTSAFKETYASQSSTVYIGIDNGNTDNQNKDVKDKIYFGKRAYSGTYSYSSNYDILSSNLLNTLTDVFLFNTKTDTISNIKTRVVILSGSNSSLFNYSPYIQSQIVTVGASSSLSLDIVNPTITGSTYSVININSNYGTVSVNEISFPRPQESSGLDVGLTAAGDGRVLAWDNGKLSWIDLVYSATSYVGVTGSATNIYGTPVNVNGYSIEFTESRGCPISIGDIQVGETFNSISIEEMLRRIIYPYLPPLCSISILPPYSSGYVEVGTSPVVRLQYTINKRTLPTNTAILSYMIPSIYPAITSAGQVTIIGSASGVVITPIISATTSFTITVGDGVQSNSATDTITGVYPYFYGFSSLTTMTSVGLSSLTKIIESVGDKTVDIYGSGNLYFIYDSNYPVLSSVLDDGGNNIFGSFSSSLLTFSSPTGLWASKQFRIYQYNGVSQIGPPSVNYQFKY